MYDFVGRQGGDVEPKQQIYDLKIRIKLNSAIHTPSKQWIGFMIRNNSDH
jgi:hypothetical protein